jgi:E3 ubiquitin-protein ligase UBR7
VCDCGTTRFPPASPCTLRADPGTGTKGVHSQLPAQDNKYNQNFRNRFCGCNEEYDAHKEKGTMFQCLGLGSAETGGCGEDWWHPECLIGLPRGGNKVENQKDHSNEEENGVASGEDEQDEIPLPPGFPAEDDFETFICYKCLDSHPWLKCYAGTPGFLPPVHRDGNSCVPQAIVDGTKWEENNTSKKRKSNHDDADVQPEAKRIKEGDIDKSVGLTSEHSTSATPKQKHDFVPSKGPAGPFSLFVKEDFREHLCHCPDCFPNLIPHPQLREEEETYEPPLSEDGDEANAGGSQGTGSLLERGEAALSNMDRVRAIEGVMAYNHLRDRLKEFLRPFAESGQAVGAEDIKTYFEKLRGDDLAIREAGGQASAFSSGASGGDRDGEDGDHRKEQGGRR